MKQIVFATNNTHKLDEIRKITNDQLQFLSLSDINCNEEIDETGVTLEENALLKARYVKERYGYDCFADDTGLEVEVLDGEPGVYSARYAGEGCQPEENMRKLLSVLEGVENRHARFRTVIALLINSEEHLFEGVVNGLIIEEKEEAVASATILSSCPRDITRPSPSWATTSRTGSVTGHWPQRS